ncbi:BrnA antitoxin family protein [Rhizobium lusitanum]|uniref:BrnA antitoxin family protein n=1 Tax=Rhizobium lusitanum TaxID=293958 RepID=UPI00195ABABE|nr:BrnA antitoxin family protein [Rhizobium lusitanum]MBM7049714.1 BrnA antitoxin family protein [Rhizobium lusitanum]
MAIRFERVKEHDPKRTGKRGRPKVDNPKELLTLRLDPRIIKHFKSTGEGWHKRLEAVLLNHLHL